MSLRKITSKVERRVYDDACGAAHALDLIGERWALLVMRELFWGPKRFSDLRIGLPGISANVLTQRLAGLEASAIVRRRKLAPPAGVQVYELTPWGRESEPIFQALGRWAARSPTHDPTKPFSASSLMLSLRTMFAPARAEGFAAKVGLLLDEPFLATVKHRRIEIVPGEFGDADTTLRGSPPTIAGVIYGGVSSRDLEASGALMIRGDRRLVRKFVTLFPMPEKAAAC